MSNPNQPNESTDPYQEPPNSTVGDWHGQVVDDATEQAEQALDDGASRDEAEDEYNEAIDRRSGGTGQAPS